MTTNVSDRVKTPQRGAWWIWGGFALVMAVAPLLWTSSFAQTMLSQIGIAIIACLAYNILLGQGGMLSFGHAVYSGLGSFLAIHTLNMVTAGKLALPVGLIPLVGGMGSLAGAFAASILIGLLQTLPLTVDASLADAVNRLGASVGPQTPGWPILRITLAQAAPILPYLMLVLMLIFRPKGLLGTREG